MTIKQIPAEKPSDSFIVEGIVGALSTNSVCICVMVITEWGRVGEVERGYTAGGWIRCSSCLHEVGRHLGHLSVTNFC